MKSILITGASSGIGKATTELFIQQGWTVIATMRTPKPIPGATVLPLDVTKPKTISLVKEEIIKTLGSIDVVVNNAGYGLSGGIDTCSMKEIQQQYDTNVFGVIRVIQEFLPIMKQQNNGKMILVSSIVGKMCVPNMGIYSSTKFAVEAIGEALWHDLYHTNIRAKIIEPGAIATQFIKNIEQGDSNKPLHYHGSPPMIIAKLIYTAATSRSRKLRYTGGKLAVPAMIARKILPDWIFLPLLQWQKTS